MNVAVFHPGTQHSWQTALALQELGRLEWFATSLFYQPDRWPYTLERLPGPIGRALKAEFRRLAGPELDPARVRTHGLAEWLERIAARGGLPRLQQALDRVGNRRFGRALAPAIRAAPPFALWGYNNSARTAFELGRRNGRACILDRTIGDWRAYNAVMIGLQERYGDWFADADRGMDAATIANEDEEHRLADRILVGCDFAADTVRRHAATPEIAANVEVLPYCFDEHLFAGAPPPAPVDRAAPVRFLFVGQAIPRKGIHHVLEAVSALPADEARLTIVGRIGIPAHRFAPHADRVDHRPTVPRADVPAIMAAHDVLLFPSYFEGAGLVLYEALAAGMALIQSDRAAIAVTPQTGVLLPELSTEALVAAMRTAIDERDRLDHWRASAQAEAQRYSFAGYRGRIATLLDTMGL